MVSRLKPRKLLAGRESGQAIILGSVMMVAIMGIVAVAFDIGAAWTQRRNMQNVADSAALAGAQELDGTPDGAGAAADEANIYVAKNVTGLSAPPNIAVSDGDIEITVQVAKVSPSFFLGTMGIGDNNLGATAAARLQSVSNLIPCVQPLGVKQSTFQLGVETESDKSSWVEIKIGFTGGPGGTNNTGLLDLVKVSDDIMQGACGVLEPTNDTDPGNKLGEVIKGFQDRLSAANNRSGGECYTETAVRTQEYCIPSFLDSDGVQPTALVLVPILDPSQNGVDDLRGKENLPLWEVSDGNYKLAYFWVDGNKTFKNKNGNPNAPLNFNSNQPWDCRVEEGSNKCVVFGRFVSDIEVRLELLGCPEDSPDCLIDFDPETSLIKLVQLVK